MRKKIIDILNFESKHSGILSVFTSTVLILTLLQSFSSDSKNHELEVLRNHPVFSVRLSDKHITDNKIEKNLIISAKHSEVDNISINAISAIKLLSQSGKVILIPIYDYYLPCVVKRDFSKSDIGFCYGNQNYRYNNQLHTLFENLEFISIENYLSIKCQMKDKSICDTYIRHTKTGDFRDLRAKNNYQLLEHLIEKGIQILWGFNPKNIENKIITEFDLQ